MRGDIEEDELDVARIFIIIKTKCVGSQEGITTL